MLKCLHKCTLFFLDTMQWRQDFSEISGTSVLKFFYFISNAKLKNVCLQCKAYVLGAVVVLQ